MKGAGGPAEQAHLIQAGLDPVINLPAVFVMHGAQPIPHTAGP